MPHWSLTDERNVGLYQALLAEIIEMHLGGGTKFNVMRMDEKVETFIIDGKIITEL